jgi:hypothetical protein
MHVHISITLHLSVILMDFQLNWPVNVSNLWSILNITTINLLVWISCKLLTCWTEYASAEGIPSIGLSPFACGWSTQQRKVSKLENCRVFGRLLTYTVLVGLCRILLTKMYFAYYFTYFAFAACLSQCFSNHSVAPCWLCPCKLLHLRFWITMSVEIFFDLSCQFK